MKALALLSIILLNITFYFTTAPKLEVNKSKAVIDFYFEDKDVRGSFSSFNADIYFDKDDLENSSMKGTVRSSTIYTGNMMRDKSFKGEKFLHIEKYPRIHFESKEIFKADKGYRMKGNITIKNHTKPVTFKFNYVDNKLKGSAKVYAKDFGIYEKKNREDTKTVITIQLPVSKEEV